MADHVILVDKNDNEIGTEEKILAHQKKLLHRAFSIFLFNDNLEILLQKRAPNKYHSGNLWTNTCCSHPVKNLSLEESAQSRLVVEMGIEAKLKRFFLLYMKLNLKTDCMNMNMIMFYLENLMEYLF